MEKLITQKEAAMMLGVSVKTIQILRRERRLDYYRLGHKTVRLIEESVLKFKREAHYEAK